MEAAGLTEYLRRSLQRFRRLSDAPNMALVSGYFTSSNPMLSTLRREQDVAEVARRFRGELTMNQTPLAAIECVMTRE